MFKMLQTVNSLRRLKDETLVSISKKDRTCGVARVNRLSGVTPKTQTKIQYIYKTYRYTNTNVFVAE